MGFYMGIIYYVLTKVTKALIWDPCPLGLPIIILTVALVSSYPTYKGTRAPPSGGIVSFTTA